MNKENCALNLVDEIILYYDALSKKHQSLKCSVHVTNNISFPFMSLCCLAFQKTKIKAASYEILGSAEILCF